MHFKVSILKSVIRIGSCVLSIVFINPFPVLIGFIVAECFGIIEEIVDSRKE